MKFKIYQKKIYIDTYSDKEIVDYLYNLLESKKWTCASLKNYDASKFQYFDGVPRYYAISIVVKMLFPFAGKPDSEYLNPIRIKKDVEDLVEFVTDITENLLDHVREYPRFIVVDINESIELFTDLKFENLKKWSFEHVFNRNWIEGEYIVRGPKYLYFDIHAKTIGGGGVESLDRIKDFNELYKEKYKEPCKIIGFNISSREELRNILNMADTYAKALEHIY